MIGAAAIISLGCLIAYSRYQSMKDINQHEFEGLMLAGNSWFGLNIVQQMKIVRLGPDFLMGLAAFLISAVVSFKLVRAK